MYSQVSFHCRHYTASLLQLCCTAKSHPTAVTVLPIQGISFVQTSLNPLQSLYCQFSADLLHSHVSSHSSQYTVSSVQLCCKAKTHPTAFTLMPVHFSSVVQPSLIPKQSLACHFSAARLYSQVSSHSSQYTPSSVQLCCTAKSHPTAVIILPVQCSCIVQPRLIQQQSLYCLFSAAILYSQVSFHSSYYPVSSLQLCCTDKSYPTAVTIPHV